MSNGLPALPAGVDVFSDAVLLVADAISLPLGIEPQWGIFDSSGNPVVIADNVVSFEYKQDFAISNYPVEQGQFSSYNKTQRPFQVRFRFSSGGSLADREALLNSVQAIIGDTNLYTAASPEAIYSNVNATHQEYRRTASNGAGLISIDVWFEQVRSTAQAGTSNTSTSGSGTGGGTGSTSTSNQVVSNDFNALGSAQSPTDMPQVNGGNVQPQTPTVAQQSAATGVINQSIGGGGAF